MQARSGLMVLVQQRHMAAASELTVQEPDWDTFYSLVTSDEAKREVGSLRTQFNELRQKLTKPSTVCLLFTSAVCSCTSHEFASISQYKLRLRK